MTTTVPPRPRGRPRDPGLRARREDEILTAAALAFAREGYDGLDLGVLADRIGIGKGTLYRYFASKEALFEATVDRITAQLYAMTDAAADRAADPVERIGCAVRAYLAHFDAHPEHVELIVQERAVFRDRRRPTYFRHRDAKLAGWQEELTALVRRGVLRDVPVSRVVDVVGYVLQGAIFTNHLAGRTGTFEEQARGIVDVLLRGILAPSAETPASSVAPAAAKRKAELGAVPSPERSPTGVSRQARTPGSRSASPARDRQDRPAAARTRRPR